MQLTPQWMTECGVRRERVINMEGGRIEKSDYLKIKLGRKNYGINKFPDPMEVWEVHEWHVVLHN